jgi:hypothetical protein
MGKWSHLDMKRGRGANDGEIGLKRNFSRRNGYMATLVKTIALSFSFVLASIANPQVSRYWQAPLKKDFDDPEGGETAFHSCTLAAKKDGNAVLYCLPLFVKKGDTSYSSSDGYRYIEEGNWKQSHDTLTFNVKRKTAGPGGSVSANEERKYKVRGDKIDDILPPYQKISEKEFNHWLWKWGNENAKKIENGK